MVGFLIGVTVTIVGLYLADIDGGNAYVASFKAKYLGSSKL